ncbi:IS200/IS605 family transposase, partial [Candidatus Beckwithbacteria bacterium]|nr:IS200/IS605 family transposase [Candidatus Beckwithbacteria bacterium]
SFWADGYFAETIGKTNYLQIKKYIKDNKEIMPEKD